MTAISEMFLVLPAIYLMNQVDWTKPEHLLYVRVAYVSVQIIALILWLYLYKMISDKNNKMKIKTPGGSGSTEQEMTICEYDLSQVKKALNQLGIGFLVVAGIHWKWEIIQPLFLQSLMVPLQLYKNPIIKIHLLGQTGAVEARPFKEESPFSTFMQAPQPPTNQPTTIDADNDNDNAPRVQELPDDTDDGNTEVTSNKKDKSKESTKKSSRTKRDNY